jgi:hypothetical protein
MRLDTLTPIVFLRVKNKLFGSSPSECVIMYFLFFLIGFAQILILDSNETTGPSFISPFICLILSPGYGTENSTPDH